MFGVTTSLLVVLALGSASTALAFSGAVCQEQLSLTALKHTNTFAK